MQHVPGEQTQEQAVPSTVIAPSKEAKDDRARSAMAKDVEVLGKLPGRLRKAAENGAEIAAEEEAGDIIAVRQGNVFGTSFHPELTSDIRIHAWWLMQVLDAIQPVKNGI